MLNFSLIGYGGYVAPRHYHAIKETGNKLISAFDIKSPVSNPLQTIFPDVALFSNYESYRDFHVHNVPDFVSICSPNNLHNEHIHWALEMGSHVVCEKPIVTDPGLLNSLLELEKSSGKKVHTILQLRSLQQVIELKKVVENSNERYQIELTYLSGRDENYFTSWKADETKSGGIITNIGIHLFDLVLWIFGPVKNASVFERDANHASGYLELEKADVKWLLDIKGKMVSKLGVSTFRELKLNGSPVRLDQGLQKLHQICYEDILNGEGWLISDASASILLCNQLNNLIISDIGMQKYHNSYMEI